MNSEKERSAGAFTVALYERSFGSEVSGDFTLPDYYSEIRRILAVTPTVIPPAKYVGDSSAEFNGVVDYTVTYVGGDGELYSIPLSSDYSFTVPLDGTFEGVQDTVALCSVGIDSVNTRVSAPRRMSIRCRIRPNVRIYASCAVAVTCDSDAPSSSIYTHTVKGERLVCESTASDIIPVSTVMAASDDTRIVRAQGCVDISSTQKTDVGLICRGDVRLRLLCLGEDSGEYSTLTGSMPFEGELELEMPTDGMNVRVSGVVSELSVNIGEQGIECSGGVILEALACGNAPLEYADDIYSTSNQCDCTVGQVNVKRHEGVALGSFTLSERIPVGETSLPEGAEIIEIIPSAAMDKCEAVDGKYVLTGSCVFTVIYTKDKELAVTDISLPQKYVSDIAADTAESVVFDCKCSVGNAKMRIDGTNLCVDAEVGISADIVAQRTVDTVERVVFGEPVCRRESELIVCYPSNDDTLWSVAKRYKVPQSSVVGDPQKDRFIMIN